MPPQVQELLGNDQMAVLHAAGPGAGFSGLAVTVLRRVLRVAASAKMAQDVKTAVAAYAAGVLLTPRLETPKLRMTWCACPAC